MAHQGRVVVHTADGTKRFPPLKASEILGGLLGSHQGVLESTEPDGLSYTGSIDVPPGEYKLVPAAAPAAGCQVDGNFLLGSSHEWILKGKLEVISGSGGGLTAAVSMLVDTGCCGRDFDIITTRSNAKKLGLTDATMFGSKVAGTATAANRSKIKVTQQQPAIHLMVPLFKPGTLDEVLSVRKAGLLVWAVEDMAAGARATDGGAVGSCAEWSIESSLADITELSMIAANGSERSLATEVVSSGSSDEEQQASASEVYANAGEGCQPLSPVNHTDAGMVIIGLSGLSKLGLKLHPAKRMVFGIKPHFTILTMNSI